MMNVSNCPAWLFEKIGSANLTIDDVNSGFIQRNLAGIVFIAIMMLIGIAGNTVVLFAYYFTFRPSNYRLYVLFLAVLDIVHCILAMPWSILYIYFPVRFPDDNFCRIGLFVGYSTALMSAGSLVLIAFDRYRKICCPLKPQISVRQAKYSCLAIIAVALFSSWFTPLLYENESITFWYRPNSNMVQIPILGERCSLAKGSVTKILSRGYYIILIVMFLIITCTLSLFYYRIMKKVQVHRRRFTVDTGRSGSDNGRRNITLDTRKTTFTFLIITAVYILCTIPHLTCGMIYHFVDSLECHMNFISGAIFYTFYWTVFINNVANPFIYGVSDERFRRFIKDFLRKKKLAYSRSRSGSSNPKCHSISVEPEANKHVCDADFPCLRPDDAACEVNGENANHIFDGD